MMVVSLFLNLESSVCLLILFLLPPVDFFQTTVIIESSLVLFRNSGALIEFIKTGTRVCPKVSGLSR